MIIAAKFASVCPVCSARIVPGSKIEWSKGAKATHVACAGGAPVASVAAGYRPARRSYSYSDECQCRMCMSGNECLCLRG